MGRLTVSVRVNAQRERVEIVVIGGGIAGLAAARDLAARQKKVVLVEARERLGGRILTARPEGWGGPVELGAQFVHVGNADLWRLMKASRSRVVKVPDAHWRSNRGSVSRIRDLDASIASVTDLIDERKAGSLSFGEYFERHPARVGRDAWMLAKNFVEGFEAAPMRGISARSLAGVAMEEGEQFIVPDGYDQPVQFLASECLRLGVRIMQGAVATSVAWKRGRVCVRAVEEATSVHRELLAEAAVIALPLGVLKAARGKGAVVFRPPLTAKRALIVGMGMGRVVRISFRFSRSGWSRILPAILRRRARGFGFIHSVVAGVPVWWSLSERPVMVGWAGGPSAAALASCSDAQRKRRALCSLAKILGVRASVVLASVIDMAEWEWDKDP